MTDKSKVGPGGWTRNTHKRSASRRVRNANRALRRIDAAVAFAESLGTMTPELDLRLRQAAAARAELMAATEELRPTHEANRAAQSIAAELSRLGAVYHLPMARSRRR